MLLSDIVIQFTEVAKSFLHFAFQEMHSSHFKHLILKCSELVTSDEIFEKFLLTTAGPNFTPG